MVSEALLEMHYHRSLIDLFNQKFHAGTVCLLKPSLQRECWVGFDQGFAVTTYSTREVLADVVETVQKNGTTFQRIYLAYFFQFKIVKQMQRLYRSLALPHTYRSPYYRSKLDLAPNRTTGLSQHETLLRLAAVVQSQVMYACGMVFTNADIFKPVDLDTLRLVSVRTAPTNWRDYETHHLAFRNPTDRNPFWCSEPVEASAVSPQELLEENGIVPLTATELKGLLQSRLREVRINRILNSDDVLSWLPSSFNIVMLERKVPG